MSKQKNSSKSGYDKSGSVADYFTTSGVRHFIESLNANKDMKSFRLHKPKQKKQEKKQENKENNDNKIKQKQTPSKSRRPNADKAQGAAEPKTKKRSPAKSNTKRPSQKPTGKQATAKRVSKENAHSKQGEQKTNIKPKPHTLPQLDTNNKFYRPLTFAQKMQARKSLAIDIDVDKIRFIVLEKANNHIQIKSWGIQRFPHESHNRYRSLHVALENIKKKYYKSGMEVYASIFTPEINVRQIVLPYIQKKAELEKAIYFKNRSDLPNFNEHSVCRYDVIEHFQENSVDKVKLMVVVVPGNTINKILNVFRYTNIDLKRLMPRPLALHAAYQHILPEHQNDLLIDISYDLTQICYVKKGRLYGVSNLSMGSRNLEVSIHPQKEEEAVNPLFSQKDKSESGAPEGDMKSQLKKRLKQKITDLKTKQNPVLHTYFSEILRVLSHFQGKGNNNLIDRIFLSGYGIRKESLIPYLKSRLNIPMYLLMPQFSKNNSEQSIAHSEYFVTIGTALSKNKAFNLITKEYLQEKLLKKANVLGVLLLALGIAGFGYFHVLQERIINQKAHMVSQLQQEYQQLNPIEGKYQELEQKLNQLQTQNQQLTSYFKEPVPVVEVMKLFSNETPPEIRLTRLSFIRGTGDNDEENQAYKVSVECTIEGPLLKADVIIIDFINHLKELDYFKSIGLDHKRKNRREAVTYFGFSAKL